MRINLKQFGSWNSKLVLVGKRLLFLPLAGRQPDSPSALPSSSRCVLVGLRVIPCPLQCPVVAALLVFGCRPGRFAPSRDQVPSPLACSWPSALGLAVRAGLLPCTQPAEGLRLGPVVSGWGQSRS